MTRVVPRNELPNANAPAREDAPRLSVGMRLGRYELLTPIAEGGMAQVWAAEQTGDLGFRKLIALKTIRPDFAHDAGFRAMFLDEAQLASRIRHVNVVEVLDLGVDGEIVFQAMALVDGVAASEWMRSAKERIPLGVSVRVAIDMLHGLHAAHTLMDDEGHPLGLVHRDVSPQNVLVGSDGVAKLADFGIAKAFGRAAEETFVGDVKGKVAYVAPEQLRGLPAAPQSDLYSAGVVFWELLTGQRLFVVAKDGTKRHQLTVRDPRTIVPDLPASICAIAMRALLDDPLARYETTLEMADALEAAARKEDLVVSHRAVATALEKDVGRKLDAVRTRLRQAKKRTGMVLTPTPIRTSEPRLEAQRTAVLPISVSMPATQRAIEVGTDTVTIAATPQPIFDAPLPPRRSTSGVMLPLTLAGVMLVLLVGLVASRRHAPPPPAPVQAVEAPPPVQAAQAPPPEPTVAATAMPVVVPAPSASTAPAIHRPPLPHGRTRAPAPAPKPATTPAIGPRFDNPY